MNYKELFIDKDDILLIRKELVRVLGDLNEAVILNQLHYWIEINRKVEKNFYDDRYWVFNTYQTWKETDFDFWSTDTIRRTLTRLENKGIVLTANYNKLKIDKTKWYTINYEKLQKMIDEYEEKQNAIKEKADCGYDMADCTDGNGNISKTIPENTSKNTNRDYNTETTFNAFPNGKEKNKTRAREKFIPPTVEEVRSYCEERGNEIESEYFVDFYASKGWYVGRNKMKDWKATVRIWERNNKNNIHFDTEKQQKNKNEILKNNDEEPMLELEKDSDVYDCEIKEYRKYNGSSINQSKLKNRVRKTLEEIKEDAFFENESKNIELCMNYFIDRYADAIGKAHPIVGDDELKNIMINFTNFISITQGNEKKTYIPLVSDVLNDKSYEKIIDIYFSLNYDSGTELNLLDFARSDVIGNAMKIDKIGHWEVIT